jgi:ribosomal protein S18 acetylase RimI-like enzyme
VEQLIDIKKLSQFTIENQMGLGRNGYISNGKYIVEKSESVEQTIISLRRVTLEKPYEQDWLHHTDDIERYQEMLPLGFSFGAYDGEELIGVAIVEPRDWNKTMWLWELHVSDRHREQGVGKALIEKVCQAAKLKGYRVVGLEVQNTNMPAINFYRKVGFLIEAVDLSFYTNNDIEDGEVAIFMKRKL